MTATQTQLPRPAEPPTSGPAPASALAQLKAASALAGSSTPGRLRRQSLIIVALALATGLLAALVISNRQATTLSIRDSSEPVIVEARQIQANLAEADAAAANAFLAGGIEDPEQRLRYEEAMDEAGKSLAGVAAKVGDDAESIAAIEQMQNSVAEYAGLVETARANNRLGFPVGAAYLNTASSLLTSEDGVYAQTDVVANRGASRYRNDYNSLLSTGLIPVVLAALLALALLIALLRTHTYISNTFRRRFNPPLVGAIVMSLLLVAWLAVSLVGQASGIQTAREDGFNDARQFVDARARGFRAKGAESRFLIARGGGDAAEFDAEANQVSNTDGTGILDRAIDDADGSERTRAQAVRDAWDEYTGLHETIVDAEASGDRETAEMLALNDANVAFDEFSERIDEAIESNQSQFENSMDSASSSVSWLTYGSVLLAAGIALLSLLGIQRRINEYR